MEEQNMMKVNLNLVYDVGHDEDELSFIAQIAIDLAVREGYISEISEGDDIEVKFHNGPRGDITVSCNGQTAELECVEFIVGLPLVRKRQTTT